MYIYVCWNKNREKKSPSWSFSFTIMVHTNFIKFYGIKKGENQQCLECNKFSSYNNFKLILNFLKKFVNFSFYYMWIYCDVTKARYVIGEQKSLKTLNETNFYLNNNLIFIKILIFYN